MSQQDRVLKSSNKPYQKNNYLSIVLGLVSIIGLPVSICLSSGRLNWLEGWVYIAIFLLSVLISRVYMAVKNPSLARERTHSLSADNVKAWDKWLMPLVATFGPLLISIVAGLNLRHDWAPVLSPGIKIAGASVMVAGYSVAIWAMNVNPFFSGTVRIQKDRGHQVVSDGPYQLVRHPGYLGGLLSYLGMPFLLGSLWALIPTGLTVAAVILRTWLEDNMLQEELRGYREYAKNTTHKLIPGIW